MSKKEMVVKPPKSLVVPEGGWDDGDFEAKDLLVPMIFVAQGISDIVKQGKAKPADIYETVNKTVLADSKKPVAFIPVKFFKTWVHCEVVKTRPEFRSIEPYNASNAGKYAYEEIRPDGTKWINYEVLNFYALLEEEIQKGTAFPYLISFRSSNKKKGRPLLNHMARARAMDPPKPLCSMTFNLSSVLTTKGADSWFTFDLSPKGATSEAHTLTALDWLETLNTMTHKVDTSEVESELSSDDGVEVNVNIKKGEISKEARY